MNDLHFNPLWNNDYPERDNVDDESLYEFEASVLQNTHDSIALDVKSAPSNKPHFNIWHLQVGDTLYSKDGKTKLKVKGMAVDREYIQVMADGFYDVPQTMRLQDVLENYTLKKPNSEAAKSGCECGANHTSFVNHHSDWCPMYRP